MSEILGEAVVIVRPDTTGFVTALEAQIAAATRAAAITIPVGIEAGAAASVAALGTASKDAAVASLGLADAQKVENQALAAGAVILQENTAATLEKAGADAAAGAAAAGHASQLGKVERGAAATGLSLLGARGATLAASGGFLAGAAAATIFVKSLQQASDHVEQLNKAQVVFGASSKEVVEFANSAAQSFGISSTEALKAAAIYGNLFRAIHIGTKESADMSIAFVKLASDLASFNNASPEKTLEALRAGLVGQSRPLRQYGIFLSAARVQAQALADTNKKSTKELTQSELVLARQEIIFRDSALAQGDFARTSERTANQSRILRANIQNLGETIGNTFLPAVNSAVIAVNDLFSTLNTLQHIHIPTIKIPIEIPKEAQSFFGTIGGIGGTVGGTLLRHFASFLDPFTPIKNNLFELTQILHGVDFTLGLFSSGSKDAGLSAAQLADKLGELGSAADPTAGAILLLTQRVNDFKAASRAVTGLQVQQLEIQTGLTVGGRPAEEANLRQQIEKEKRVIALAQSGSKARTDALRQLKISQDQLTALQQKDAQDAAAQAQKVKDAAQKAAEARARADQAVIDSFAGPDAVLANRQARAAATKSIADDLAVNRALIAQTKAEIAAVRTRVKDAQTRNNELRTLTSQLVAAELEHNRLLREQAAAQAARVTEARDRALEIARLNVQIAEAAGQPAAEKRALNAEIAALKLRIRQVRGNNVLVKQLTLELVQAQQKLKDLGKAAQDTHTFAQEAFGFLQTETGFTSNLIGNLIPGGATGLVGGGARPTTPAAAKVPVPPREPPTPAGPTRGQGQTTNHLLSQAVTILRQIYLGQGHPEASRQRRNGNAVMDTNVVSRGM